MAIEDNWTYKDVQEMWRDVKSGKYPRLAKYKVYTLVDGREVEVIRVRKVVSTEYLKVTVPPHTTDFGYFLLPLDQKFHVRKEE